MSSINSKSYCNSNISYIGIFITLQILRFFYPDIARKHARAVCILLCIENCLSSDETLSTNCNWCKLIKTFTYDIITSHRICVHSNLTIEWTQNPWLVTMIHQIKSNINFASRWWGLNFTRNKTLYWSLVKDNFCFLWHLM